MDTRHVSAAVDLDQSDDAPLAKGALRLMCVDTEALDQNSNELSRFCEYNREMPLLDAMEAIAK
ncbi:hypothetical protein [Bradyrhizobium sp. NAS80.1]|uniref:hypothetical protein n=1 Tax=Bradyrhizobium sp. NAS80.1 TaxID=1680159 RepID=UPI0011612968|nr:hypothetical protein [Bradyrhizobium sp. NAS80.1]